MKFLVELTYLKVFSLVKIFCLIIRQSPNFIFCLSANVTGNNFQSSFVLLESQESIKMFLYQGHSPLKLKIRVYAIVKLELINVVIKLVK